MCITTRRKTKKDHAVTDREPWQLRVTSDTTLDRETYKENILFAVAIHINTIVILYFVRELNILIIVCIVV
jgi:hypothetical protein